MDFERDTLTAVMEARAKALSATGPADAAQKEGELSQALGRLFAVAENYPTLKSNENVKMLQEELSSTENKVGFARQFYNDIATKFNTAQQMFPTNMFAGSFGFKPAELFEITDAGGAGSAGRRSLTAVIGTEASWFERMNLYEQQAIEPSQDVAGHGGVRRLLCCSATGSTPSISASAAATCRSDR